MAPKTNGLGLDLRPGDEHYRAYVGPPREYDLVAAMVFNLLTSIGLRQHHRVLDIGCGSLRIGRLLIPYLNPEHYFGVEPNKWLVEDGIANEVGVDLVRVKKPTFSFRASMEDFGQPLNLDFGIAQSIFSHSGLDLIRLWLSQISSHLKEDGALIATFIAGPQDFQGSGWIYPGVVSYEPNTMADLAAELGFDFQILNWAHPRLQTWTLFSRPKYDDSLINGGVISWNRFIEQVKRK